MENCIFWSCRSAKSGDGREVVMHTVGELSLVGKVNRCSYPLFNCIIIHCRVSRKK